MNGQYYETIPKEGSFLKQKQKTISGRIRILINEGRETASFFSW
jgi:hypothetical protein